MNGLHPFTLGIPLPAGITLVQASAGTGKTWSIARLVARVLLEAPSEGVEPPTIDQVLVMTFTKAATAELRDRVWGFLTLAREGLAAVLATPGGPRPGDEGVALLAGISIAGRWWPRPEAELRRRLGRLERALRDFDTAAIWTIHGFCQRVLQTLAFESAAAFDAELVQDDAPIVSEVLDDWIALRLVHPTPLVAGIAGGWKRSLLRARVEAAIANPAHRIVPSPADFDAQVGATETAGRALATRMDGAEGQALLRLLTDSATINLQRYPLASVRHAWGGLLARLRGEASLDKKAREFLWQKWDPAVLDDCKKRPWPTPALFHDLREHLGVLDALADALLGDLARFAKEEHAARLAAARQMTYDDLLTIVAGGVSAGPLQRELLAGLRARFRAALVDEFQDTDPSQWAIFSAIFAGSDPHGPLLLIGDPKQAIYRFRGADVDVYTHAARLTPPERRFTMGRNHRSDAPLIATLNTLLSTSPDLFFTDDIRFEVVTAKHEAPRLFAAGGRAAPRGPAAKPVRVRWFDAQIVRRGGSGTLSYGEADRALPRVVARDVAAQLAAGGTVVEEGVARPLSPGHFGVLVRTNREAARVHRELLARGVPAILGASGSVMATDEAGWLLLWLDAVTSERVDAPARRLVLTPLYGWTAQDLLALRDAGPGATPVLRRWTALTDRLRATGRLLVESGVARAAADLLHRPEPDASGAMVSVSRRIAGLRDGERRLTNLRHVIELCHRAEVSEHLGPRGVHAWLADRIAREDGEEGATEMRLETDADTVKIATVHASKGLEYPIVYATGLIDGRTFRWPDPNTRPITFHRGEERWVDLRGVDGADEDDAERTAQEVHQELQRLLYVALTRARHQAVVYAGPIFAWNELDYRKSSIGVLLHGSEGDGNRFQNAQQRVGALIGTPARLREDLVGFLENIPGVEVEDCDYVPRSAPSTLAPVAPPAGEPATAAEAAPELAPCAVFPPRDFDDLWRRESYSGLVGQRKGHVLDAREPAGGVDEPDEVDVPVSSDDPYIPEDPCAPDDPWDVEPPEDVDAPVDDVPADAGFAPWAAAGDAPADPVDPLPEPADPTEPPEAPEPESPTTGRPEALDGFERGNKAGLWVHAVLEHLDFRTGRPRTEPGGRPRPLATLIREHGQRQGFPKPDVDGVLQAALPAILATPLGSAVGDLTLADVDDRVRLNEVKFDLGIGGQADAGAAVPGGELARLLAMGRGTSPLPEGYFAWLETMPLRPLCGFLTGSIDLVLRDDRTGRWYVADYKTNQLKRKADGWRARSLEGHYTQPWLAHEIVRKNYYIQYMLYTVAVHRYLQTRVPRYDYDRHFGGVLYLFVRGMLGPSTAREAGRVNGVYFDRPDLRVIEGLSALLAAPPWKRSPRP